MGLFGGDSRSESTVTTQTQNAATDRVAPGASVNNVGPAARLVGGGGINLDLWTNRSNQTVNVSSVDPGAVRLAGDVVRELGNLATLSSERASATAQRSIEALDLSNQRFGEQLSTLAARVTQTDGSMFAELAKWAIAGGVAAWGLRAYLRSR